MNVYPDDKAIRKEIVKPLTAAGLNKDSYMPKEQAIVHNAAYPKDIQNVNNVDALRVESLEFTVAELKQQLERYKQITVLLENTYVKIVSIVGGIFYTYFIEKNKVELDSTMSSFIVVGDILAVSVIAADLTKTYNLVEQLFNFDTLVKVEVISSEQYNYANDLYNKLKRLTL